MSNERKAATEEEIALYDAMERAITNVHAALAKIDAAWRRITAERPNPSATAFAALDAADEILAVAREDLGRARTALAGYTQARRNTAAKEGTGLGGSERGRGAVPYRNNARASADVASKQSGSWPSPSMDDSSKKFGRIDVDCNLSVQAERQQRQMEQEVIGLRPGRPPVAATQRSRGR